MSEVPMHAQPLTPRFSTADCSYPELTTAYGRLTASYRGSTGVANVVRFVGVAAFSWRELYEPEVPGERWDGACELFESDLLRAHPPGASYHAVAGLRHIRLNFNECGSLDVLCTGLAHETRGPDPTNV